MTGFGQAHHTPAKSETAAVHVTLSIVRMSANVAFGA